MLSAVREAITITVKMRVILAAVLVVAIPNVGVALIAAEVLIQRG